MNHIRPFTSRLLSGLFFFAILFTACKSDQQETQTNFKYNDNTVRVRMSAEPDRINPILTTNAYSRLVNERIFMYLMDYNPISLEMTPYLVESLPEIKELEEGPYKGGISLTFEIKENAQWPNGSPVTSEDAEFSLKAILTPGMPSAYQSYFAFFKGFEKDSENPRKFTMFSNQKYILIEEVAASLVVYPKYVYDPQGLMDEFTVEALAADGAQKSLGENEEIKSFIESFTSSSFSTEPGNIVGSGPYEMKQWETGRYILLTKKKDWWGNQYAASNPLFQAYPDSLLFKKIEDQTAAINAIKDQELDVANNLDSKDFMELKENTLVTENYNLVNPVTSTIYLAYFNTHDPVLDDKKVRRGLAHLVDVDEFINSLYDGLAKRAVGPVLDTKAYYNSDLKPIPYDLEKAKSLFAEAGWKDENQDGILEKNIDGETQNLNVEILITNSSKASENLALFFQEGFKKAGVGSEVVKKEFRELLKENVRKKDYQIYIGAMTLDLTKDDFQQQWHTMNDVPGGYNYTGFGSAKMDGLIDSIRVTMNEAKRNEMYKRFQKELYDETPAMFLFSPLERIAIHKRFEAETSAKRPGFFPNMFKQKN
jgi:peptide/nickel transport system substrate-binding protein